MSGKTEIPFCWGEAATLTDVGTVPEPRQDVVVLPREEFVSLLDEITTTEKLLRIAAEMIRIR